MAILANADRQSIWADYMRLFEAGELCNITKVDLRAAVDAVDAWISDNSTAFNIAIPQPARSALSARQKARLLVVVVQKRYELNT